jgi:ribosomal protein L19
LKKLLQQSHLSQFKKNESFRHNRKYTIKRKHPAFQSGDSVRVHVRIQEGNKERLQIFEGIVIAKKHGGSRETVTVRKVAWCGRGKNFSASRYRY